LLGELQKSCSARWCEHAAPGDLIASTETAHQRHDVACPLPAQTLAHGSVRDHEDARREALLRSHTCAHGDTCERVHLSAHGCILQRTVPWQRVAARLERDCSCSERSAHDHDSVTSAEDWRAVSALAGRRCGCPQIEIRSDPYPGPRACVNECACTFGRPAPGPARDIALIYINTHSRLVNQSTKVPCRHRPRVGARHRGHHPPSRISSSVPETPALALTM